MSCSQTIYIIVCELTLCITLSNLYSIFHILNPNHIMDSNMIQVRKIYLMKLNHFESMMLN